MKKMLQILCLSFLCIGKMSCTKDSSSKSIHGRITIHPKIAEQIGPSDTLVLSAYPASEPKPKSETKQNPDSLPKSERPVAVYSASPVVFPFEYELSADDVLFPDQNFEGWLLISARIKKKASDNQVFEGVPKQNPVKVGTKGVDIVIEKKNP